MNLDQQIADLEDRIVNKAQTVEAVIVLHDQLDALIARRDGEPSPKVVRRRRRTYSNGQGTWLAVKESPEQMAHQRGYQAGYHAAQRAARRPPVCSHEGIGEPTCPTCRPRTIAALREMGIEWTDRYSETGR